MTRAERIAAIVQAQDDYDHTGVAWRDLSADGRWLLREMERLEAALRAVADLGRDAFKRIDDRRQLAAIDTLIRKALGDEAVEAAMGDEWGDMMDEAEQLAFQHILDQDARDTIRRLHANVLHELRRLRTESAKLSADHSEMTRRDAFAAAALTGLLATRHERISLFEAIDDAWEIGSAMAAAREAGR